MALLAALALAGRDGADRLAQRWRDGAQAAVTVQIPQPDPARMARALSTLRAMPEVAAAEPVDPDRMAELLRPWLGGANTLSRAGVIELRLTDLQADPVRIGDRLAAEVPGAVTEAHGVWVAHLAAARARGAGSGPGGAGAGGGCGGRGGGRGGARRHLGAS